MSLTDGPSNDLDHCTEPLPHLESGIPGSRTAEVKVRLKIVVEALLPPLLVFMHKFSQFDASITTVAVMIC